MQIFGFSLFYTYLLTELYLIIVDLIFVGVLLLPSEKQIYMFMSYFIISFAYSEHTFLIHITSGGNKWKQRKGVPGRPTTHTVPMVGVSGNTQIQNPTREAVDQ